MYKTRCLPLSLALVPVVCPQPGNPWKHESEEAGAGEMTLQSFDFGLQYLFQPLAINITYCTWDTFTFMHLADAFIQSNLQLHSGYTFFNQYVCSLGIEPTTFCAADAMLYHWATQEHIWVYQHEFVGL